MQLRTAPRLACNLLNQDVTSTGERKKSLLGEQVEAKADAGANERKEADVAKGAPHALRRITRAVAGRGALLNYCHVTTNPR